MSKPFAAVPLHFGLSRASRRVRKTRIGGFL